MIRRHVMPCFALLIVAASAGCGSGAPEALTEVQRVRAGALEVVLLSSNSSIRQGQDTFAIEFRGTDAQLVDVGDVKAGATMPMPGMGPMVGSLDIRRTEDAGRYTVSSNLSMVGDWRVEIEWSGAGGGSAVFTTAAQ